MTAPGDGARPVHILQIGTDATVFDDDAASDTRSRQLRYAAKLAERAPGSRVTYLVTTAPVGRELDEANFRARGVRGTPLAIASAIRRVHAADPVDLVATQTPFTDAWIALALGLRTRVPVLAQVHFEPFEHARVASGVPRRLLRSARLRAALVTMRACAAVRVVSETTARQLTDRGVRRVTVAPVPISVQPRAGTSVGAERRRVVLFVGRVAPEKNPRRWIAVAALVASTDAQCRFVVAGDGEALADMKRAAVEAGIADRFEWLGRVPHTQLADLYASASLLLLSSDYEGVPRVIFEAAHEETPTVATAVAGIADLVVDGETGFVRDRDDVAGLAAAVGLLLRDTDTRARLGAAAAERAAREFDPERLADRWVDLLYRTATSARGNGDRVPA